MNKLYAFLLLYLCSCQLQAQNTTISPTVFNPPSLSYEAIMTLPSPAKGSVVFDSTFNVLRIYNGTKWVYPLTAEQEQPLGMLAWKAGGSNEDQSTDVAVDAAGNVYITGFFTGTALFDTTSITSVGSFDIYVAKYNSFGKLQWVQQAGGTEDDLSDAITVDASGNVYITGYFSGVANFGSTSVTSSGYDLFIAKYSPSTHTWIWVQKAGNGYIVQSNGIAVDTSNNVYVTGYFQGTATFGSTTLTAANSDIFVAKCNNSGVFQWVQKAGGSAGDSGNDIAVDVSGNAYITGYFRNNATFSTSNLTSAGETDIFLAKYNSSGTLLWVQQAASSGFDASSGVALDTGNNVYITGGFSGTASFGATSITSDGPSDIFIAKYTNSGTVQWVQKAGGTSNGGSRDIAVGTDGIVYITGNFQGTALFGTVSITSTAPGFDDVFVAKYNPGTNTWNWAQKAGGIPHDYSAGIAVTPSNLIYITGMFLNTATFGTTTFVSLGGNDVFVARVVE